METQYKIVLAFIGLAITIFGVAFRDVRKKLIEIAEAFGEGGNGVLVPTNKHYVDPLKPQFRRLAVPYDPPVSSAIFEIVNHLEGFEPCKVMVHVAERELGSLEVGYMVEDGMLKFIELGPACFTHVTGLQQAFIRIHYNGLLQTAQNVSLRHGELQIAHFDTVHGNPNGTRPERSMVG